MKGNIKYKCLSKHRESCFAGPEYRLKYKKGTKVKAVVGSIGVMVFKTKMQAERFSEVCSPIAMKIVRVRCFGKGKSIKWLCSAQASGIGRFYRDLQFLGIQLFRMGNLRYVHWDISYQEAPLGTICYPEVEVID